MTKPKHPPHRLGFADDPHRTKASIVDAGRWTLLLYVARLAPQVLEQLHAVTPSPSRPGQPHAAGLKRWATTWHLDAPWCVAYGRATWRAWYRWPTSPLVWFDRDDVEGEQLPRRRRRRAPRPLKTADHFVWFVRYQVLGEPYLQIARSVDVDEKSVRKACATLARFLGLPLRPAERGWTRRNRQRSRSE